MYYKNTIEKIKNNLLLKFPESKPESDMSKSPNYVLWMIGEIQKMDDSERDSFRAARWIGWILRVVENDLGLWDNEESRKIIRKDVKEGYEKIK